MTNEVLLSVLVSLVSICAALGLFEGIKVIIKHKTTKKINENEKLKELAEKELENKRRNQLISDINLAINNSFMPLQQSVNSIVKDIDVIKMGIQASLRNDLYNIYYRCEKKGFAKQNDREDFENIYQQYHKLGANGVMDDIREKFLNLPTSSKRSNKNDL